MKGGLGDTESTAFLSHPAVRIASGLAAAASAYHGYKRNNSVGWAVWWGLMGAIFPIITLPVALAQGFGKRG